MVNNMNDYNYDRRIAASALKGTTPFTVEISKATSVGAMKITVQLEGGVRVGKGYERFKAAIKFDGKITGIELKQGGDLVKGILWSPEVEKYLKENFG